MENFNTEKITITSTLRRIGKLHHLTFDTHFKYYTGDAYRNDKGEYLPHYFGDGINVYILKYVDGCFNPFLYRINNAYVFSNPANGKPEIVIPISNKHSYDYIINKFGDKLTLHQI